LAKASTDPAKWAVWVRAVIELACRLWVNSGPREGPGTVSAMDLSVPVVLAPPGAATLPDVPNLKNSAFARQRGPINRQTAFRICTGNGCRPLR